MRDRKRKEVSYLRFKQLHAVYIRSCVLIKLAFIPGRTGRLTAVKRQKNKNSPLKIWMLL